ncbi:MAG: hypothetical protein NC211_04325 [Alistipes senegalensis]|nr:hypothetical protein [Oxalobacter formigenes]MCM1281043.1 hypothetical protein [Alistipes senegalensis]
MFLLLIASFSVRLVLEEVFKYQGVNMSIDKITDRIQFGVASPPYQSRSAGTDFEDMLKQIREDLKAAEMHYTRNILKPAGTSRNNSADSTQEVAQSGVPSLFKMDQVEFSLLDAMLMTALEETRLANANTPKNQGMHALPGKNIQPKAG